MLQDIILAFDIGTSAVKSSLITGDGHILESVSHDHETRSAYTGANAGQAEQNPSDWWRGACVSAKALLAKHPNARQKIVAVGVSGHMLGCVPVDGVGNPVRPAIIHSDTRGHAEAEWIKNTIGTRRLYERTGNMLNAQSPLCKIMWLKRHEPDAYARTTRFLQSKDFLVARLTGNIDTTDYSDASHAQWMDLHTQTYIRDELRTMGIDVGKLPTLHKGTDIVGTVTHTAAEQLGIPAGVPVIAGGGDGACASAGAGITPQNGLYGCLGTTAWLSYTADKPMIDPAMRLFDLTALDGARFCVVGTTQSAGQCIHWARLLFGVESSSAFDLEAAKAPAGSDGLLFLPYLNGERSPIFDDGARGVFFNINDGHNRIHFMRAVIEGVSFALCHILSALLEMRSGSSGGNLLSEANPPGVVRLIGGGARSALWKQILADVCQTDMAITDTRTDAVTSLGVALAACVGVGLYRSMDDAAACVGLAETVTPQPQNASVYRERFEKFLRLYPAVKTLF